MRLFRIEFIYAPECFTPVKKKIEAANLQEAEDWATLYAAESGMDRELCYSHYEVYDLFDEATLATFKDPEKNEWFANIYARGSFRPQVVVAAANMSECGTVMLVGARHWDAVMHAQADALPQSKYDFPIRLQGFIDQYGNFLDRVEAAFIVTQNKQPLREPIQSLNLYSENLY